MIESLSKHFLRVKEKVWPLRPSNRISIRSGKDALRPATVVLIVNESMGVRGAQMLRHYKKSCPHCRGLYRISQHIKADPASYIIFENAFTSSLATQVSMPSIFSGVGPEESHRHLHKVPLLWDMAHAAGYTTGYFTSQRIRWASMNDFLLKQPLDTLVSREVTSFPIANDMGVDDFQILEIMKQWIKTHKNQPLFLLWNTNALHAPFQENSEYIDLSGVPGSRHDKALDLIDSVSSKFFEILKEEGRWNDALIISTGDHADDPEPSHPLARLNSNYDEFIRLPIWIKVPSTLQGSSFLSQMQRNREQPMSNADLAPTLAHLWDIQSNDSYQLTGSSLGRSLNKERVLAVLSTNDTRSWAGEGFGLIQGEWRLVLVPPATINLYHIPTDSLQKHNLYEQAPDSVLKIFENRIANNAWLKKIYAHYKNQKTPTLP